MGTVSSSPWAALVREPAIWSPGQMSAPPLIFPFHTSSFSPGLTAASSPLVRVTTSFHRMPLFWTERLKMALDIFRNHLVLFIDL